LARPIVRASLIGAALGLLTLALVVRAIVSSNAFRCEACVQFHGELSCREALGPSPEAATRTAVENACAFVAHGMTETVECTNAPRPRVECRPR